MEKLKKPKKSEIFVVARETGGNSIEITIPRTIAYLMKIKKGTRIELDMRERTYGRRLSIWNYDQQIEEYNERQGKE